MHIKSIIIDGFKSYAQRTEINGFDPLFNAITGLNGSGKSNILDSICFLLGISNLSHVRASNLQDLVYKNGQAGITKATVSITFDNSNKSQSPLGFETHDEITVTRQVVIGGRNKYLINGVNANNTRVQDLFCSVGLNVNNPHFLIMQGRITKVLTMKPPEILAMIEEAAGTRMYECKKISAQKTIEKKEAKLKEIHTILDEEITPTMEKLKDERSSYLEYQKLMREIQHLSRLYVAWLFVCAEETNVKSAEALKVMQDNISQMQSGMAGNECKEVGSVLKELEDAVSDVQRVDTKAQSALDLKKQNLQDEAKKGKELVKTMEEDKKMVVVKEKEVAKLQEALQALQAEGQEDGAALEAAEQHFRAVSAGLSTNEDGEEATLAGQMMTCKNDMSKADTEAKQAQMTLKHAQAELKTKQAEVKKMDGGYKKDQDTLQALQASRGKLQSELTKLNYQGVTCPGKDPERDWDRSRVKGLLANLISIKDISAKTLSQSVVSTAKSLVGRGQRAHGPVPGGATRRTCARAMEYVFGSTLVLRHAGQRPRKVAFDQRVRTKTVTLGGDIFDPQGTLSGGARSQTASVLSSLQEVREVGDQLSQKEAQLQDLEHQLAGLKGTAEKYRQLKQQESEGTLRSTKEVQKRAEEKYKESEVVGLELAELRREQAGYEQQIQAVAEAKQAVQEQIDNMASTVAQNKEAVRKAQEELAMQKEIIMTQDKDIKEKTVEANKIREQTNEAQLKIKELEHNISKHKKESQDAAAKVSRMLQEHDWILLERRLFGQPNTAYDFQTKNPREAGQRLKKLEETTSRLERNVNKRAMNMLNEAEERYNDLMKKKRIVENDKSKILQTIAELDQKKNEALNVNKDFGSISPPCCRGQTPAWPRPRDAASWTAWSSEHRTDVAHTLQTFVVVSLKDGMFTNANVLFKTKFVDGMSMVDAALDLSHTQNIGQMLRTHFRHSQFVVVSLKDGMFTNANVLFKTKFVDGMSMVSRTALSQSDANLPPKAHDKPRQGRQEGQAADRLAVFTMCSVS
ncbi:hypothetical protein CRUP_011712 [Coryphaenoides rupestris]|nr:hypothetical protein CRUP_011712 [Coryphaenoides rupestris]